MLYILLHCYIFLFVGGKFFLDITIPESYPFNPPKVEVNIYQLSMHFIVLCAFLYAYMYVYNFVFIVFGILTIILHMYYR